VIEAVLASGNLDKLAELREALPAWRIDRLEISGAPEETGTTYYENARIKARFGRGIAAPELWVIGEDSGIECEALGGGPGLHSARWADGRDPADALLERLQGEPNRRARMVSGLVCFSPEQREFHGAGVLRGEIAHVRRGEGGFGYDPIFVPEGFETTVAEIGDAWKRRSSHRARAAHALAAAIAAAPA
jgi:XTP/dITP diphosphohydrolase